VGGSPCITTEGRCKGRHGRKESAGEATKRGAMPDFTAQRTLVKSPPELWSELSELDRLAKHLGAFGEIRITRLEPESEVAWEGECASGTAAIEASGWGTKVTLTATVPEVEAEAPEPEEPVEAEPEEPAEPTEPPTSALEVTESAPGDARAVEPEPAPAKRRFFARLVARWRAGVADETPAAVEPEPGPEPEPELEPGPPAEPEPPREPEPVGVGDGAGPSDEAPRDVLEGVLDNLGAAHHRPFSRA
jgi:hypothetical protein